MAITFLKNCNRSHRRGHSRKQWRSHMRWNLRYGGGGGGHGVYPKVYEIFFQIFLNLSQYFLGYLGFQKLKYEKLQTYQIDHLSPFLTSGATIFGLNIHSMKKNHLLDFSIQRLWGKTSWEIFSSAFSFKIRFNEWGSLGATPPKSF